MSLTAPEFRLFKATYETIKTVLVAAQKERPQRQDILNTPTGPEMAWVAYERQTMLTETNRVRADLNLPSITEADIARAESRACGHSDYTNKYALYCAELAMGLC